MFGNSLRKIVRNLLVNNKLRDLMVIIWEEHERLFHEDNSATRFSHIEEELVSVSIGKGLYHPRPRFRD